METICIRSICWTQEALHLLCPFFANVSAITVDLHILDQRDKRLSGQLLESLGQNSSIQSLSVGRGLGLGAAIDSDFPFGTAIGNALRNSSLESFTFYGATLGVEGARQVAKGIRQLIEIPIFENKATIMLITLAKPMRTLQAFVALHASGIGFWMRCYCLSPGNARSF